MGKEFIEGLCQMSDMVAEEYQRRVEDAAYQARLSREDALFAQALFGDITSKSDSACSASARKALAEFNRTGRF